MTVLVTGGSGFVGQSIVTRLLDEGRRLRLAQRSPVSNEFHRRGVQHAPINDLAEPIDWAPALEGVEAIVHVAGLAHQPPGVSDKAMFKINSEATARLARSAANAGVRRFIFISSIRAIVGASSTEAITDETPPAPVDAYGRSKLEAEQAIAATNFNGAILRPVLIVGAKAGGNLGLLRKLAALPLPLPIAGLSGRRSLISDRSLAQAVSHLLAIEPRPMASYLAAHPDSMTVSDIVTAMRQTKGRAPGMFSIPPGIIEAVARLAGRSEMLKRVTGDLIVRADHLTAIGWKPVETTAEALSRLA